MLVVTIDEFPLNLNHVGGHGSPKSASNFKIRQGLGPRFRRILRQELPASGLRVHPFPSFWRDKHLQSRASGLQEHHAGHSFRTKKTPPSQKGKTGGKRWHAVTSPTKVPEDKDAGREEPGQDPPVHLGACRPQRAATASRPRGPRPHCVLHIIKTLHMAACQNYGCEPNQGEGFRFMGGCHTP